MKYICGCHKTILFMILLCFEKVIFNHTTCVAETKPKYSDAENELVWKYLLF